MQRNIWCKLIRHWKLILKLGTKHLRSDLRRPSQCPSMEVWRTWRWFPYWELLYVYLQKLLPGLYFGRSGRISYCTRRRRWMTVLEAGWWLGCSETPSHQNNQSSWADTKSRQPPPVCAYAATSFHSSQMREHTLSVPVDKISAVKIWFNTIICSLKNGFYLVFQCGKWFLHFHTSKRV